MCLKCYNAQCIVCLAWQWTLCNVCCRFSYAVDVWSLSTVSCISCTRSNDNVHNNYMIITSCSCSSHIIIIIIIIIIKFTKQATAHSITLAPWSWRTSCLHSSTGDNWSLCEVTQTSIPMFPEAAGAVTEVSTCKYTEDTYLFIPAINTQTIPQELQTHIRLGFR